MEETKKQYQKRSFLLMKDDFEERLSSQSGGAFAALSDVVLGEGGVVYGCALTKDLEVRHIRVTTKEEREALKGSKYTQSYLGGIFQDVKKDLKEGRLVLFSGVSCQVAGLKEYIESIGFSSNLLTIDLLCHGCPSQKIFKDFMEYIEKKKSKKIASINFRNKLKYGWQSHIETVTYEDSSCEDSYIYTKIFHLEAMQKPSCQNCPFHSQNRPSDITVADAWGAIKENPEMVDNNGLSLVICNTEKGLKLLSKISGCTTKEIELKGAYLEGPISRDYLTPSYSNKLWRIYLRHGFEKAFRYASRVTFFHAVKNKIRKCIKLPPEDFKPLTKFNAHEGLYSQTYINAGKANESIRLPILYKSKTECMGCGACYNRCKEIKDAISMTEDSKGFFYPVVDASKCIGCHSCEKVCPFKKYDKR